MKIRIVKDSDYNAIIPIMNEWWGGRHISDMLPKLFFIHFKETSFVAEESGKIIGFIVGFVSQTFPNEAYIHFVGVDPKHRNIGMGRELYTIFMDTVRKKGCEIIRCVTSPVNKTSIQYHKKMGFDIEPGDYLVDGVPVTKDYDGVGGDRVLFKKTLNMRNRSILL
jgi:ribosomal protein S18 acetylase RimI-like enzyme